MRTHKMLYRGSSWQNSLRCRIEPFLLRVISQPDAPALVSISSDWLSAPPRMKTTRPAGSCVGSPSPSGQERLWWRRQRSCLQQWSKDRQREASWDKPEMYVCVCVCVSYLADNVLLDNNGCAGDTGQERLGFHSQKPHISWDYIDDWCLNTNDQWTQFLQTFCTINLP